MSEPYGQSSSSTWIPAKIERPTFAEDRGTSELLTYYLNRLIGEINSMEFGDPSEYLAATGVNLMRAADLTDVWVMPMVQEIHMGTEASQSAKTSIPVPLERIIFEGEGRAQVLLGGPGAGKSTVCRYVAARLAKEAVAADTWEGLIPLVVPSRYLERVPAREFNEALVTAAVESVSGLSNRLRPSIVEALIDVIDRAYVLLDGLDEAPSDQAESDSRMTREEILREARRFGEGHPSARCLVTSREADFVFEGGLHRLFPVHYVLDNFDRGQVNEAIRKWHAAAADMASEQGVILPNWDRREHALRDLVRADPDLGELAEVPLLLNLMQLVFRAEDDFPKNVSQLAMRALSFLLLESPRLKTANEDKLGRLLSSDGAELLLDGLRRIAFEATSRIVHGTKTSFTPGDMYEALDEESTNARDRGRGVWSEADIGLLTRHLRGRPWNFGANGSTRI